MTTKLTVLNQIESDLKENLHAANDYEVTPAEIRRGIFKWDDFIVKPIVGFTLISDIPDDDNGAGENARWLNIKFYMFSEIDVSGDTTQIFQMVEDLESFFQSTDHFTYSNQTLIKEIEVFEGGSHPVQYASIDIQIIYES